MSQKTFHWRQVERSAPLQRLLDILQSAAGPMTQMEIQLEAQARGGWVANPSTEIGEIGENEGYAVSGGVLFPDNKYRYWLIQAPEWKPRWMVDADLNVIGYVPGREWEWRKHRGTRGREDEGRRGAMRDDEGRGTRDERAVASIGQESPANDRPSSIVPLVCISPACGRMLPEGHQGLPVCGDICRRVYFDSMQGRLVL